MYTCAIYSEPQSINQSINLSSNTNNNSDPGIVYRRAVDEEAGQALTNHNGHNSTELPAPATAPLAAGDSAQSQGSMAPLTGPASSTGSGFVPQVEPPTVVQATSRSGAPVDPNARIPCTRCEMSRPVGASHCYDCEVCVKGVRACSLVMGFQWLYVWTT